eukprot:scaffold12750_cov168-Ochromonas_danica.AAC.4
MVLMRWGHGKNTGGIGSLTRHRIPAHVCSTFKWRCNQRPPPQRRVGVCKLSGEDQSRGAI